MLTPSKGKSRYEVAEILGEGGMGVVYRAYDVVLKTEVALKTVKDVYDQASLKFFFSEVDQLAQIVHPNLIEIRDTGEFEEGSVRKPFLVMPLLRGATLAHIIATSRDKLTVERFLDIISQTCRGLHALHEHGMVHRDIKPSNIFVLDDDSVKIIDFGLTQQVTLGQTVSRKAAGTLFYMSPEQVLNEKVTRLSDIFSLGVVCYEALTGIRPFDGDSQRAVEDAILERHPEPISALNSSVGFPASQAVHRALAKSPQHRYETAKLFSEVFKRACNNEPIEIFDSRTILPRIERAAKDCESGEFEFAARILAELSAEGHIHPEITRLKHAVSVGIRDQKVEQLLDRSRKLIDHNEFPEALKLLSQALALAPRNSDAVALRSAIESRQAEASMVELLDIAKQHLDTRDFSKARDALKRIVHSWPQEPRALHLMSVVNRKERSYVQAREDKDRLYRDAVEAERKQDFTSALSRLEALLELEEKEPDPGMGDAYRALHNRVRSESDFIGRAQNEAQKRMAAEDFPGVVQLCEDLLAKYPESAFFKWLKADAGERHQRTLSRKVAELDARLECEPDLEFKVAIVEEAIREHAGAAPFQDLLKRVKEKRDAILLVVGQARAHEEAGEFREALARWETTRSFYPEYPGLSAEIARVEELLKRERQLEKLKHWLDRIQRAVDSNDLDEARQLISKALELFPQDRELSDLKIEVDGIFQRVGQAQSLLSEGIAACKEGRYRDGVGLIRNAYELNSRNDSIRVALVEALEAHARTLFQSDPAQARSLLVQILELEPGHALARNHLATLNQQEQETQVAQCLLESERLRSQGSLEGALELVRSFLGRYAGDQRLQSRYEELRRMVEQAAQAVMEQAPRARSVETKRPPVVEAPRHSDEAPKTNRTRYLMIAAAATVAVAVVAIWAFLHMAGAGPGSLTIATVPPGATVFVGGTESGTATSPLEKSLQAGTIELEARMPGYRAARSSVDLKSGARAGVTLTLEPEPVHVQVLGVSEVLFDDEPVYAAQEGKWVREVNPREHRLTLRGPQGVTTSLRFGVSERQVPALLDAIQATGTNVVVLSTLGQTARVYSAQPTDVKIGGHTVGVVGPEGSEAGGLSAGTHRIELGKTGETSFSVDIGAERSFVVFLDQKAQMVPVAGLTVLTNEDGAQVNAYRVEPDGSCNQNLNATPSASGLTTNRRFPFTTLAPGRYCIEVSKAGLPPIPVKSVDLSAGTQQRLAFAFPTSEAATPALPPPPAWNVFYASVDIKTGQRITIQGDKCSMGECHGDALPGKPVKIEIVPSYITIEESPSAANQYKKLVMRSSAPAHVVVQVRWQLLP